VAFGAQVKGEFVSRTPFVDDDQDALGAAGRELRRREGLGDFLAVGSL
jgi:hypothetical protein